MSPTPTASPVPGALDRARPDPSALRTTLRHLLPLLGREKPMIALGLGAVFLSVLATLAEPWPLKIVIDDVLPAAAATPGGGLPALAWVAAVALLLAVLLRAVGSYAATVCFALIGSRVTTTLRDRTYDRLLRQSLAYHQRNQAGDLLSRLTADILRIQEVAVTAGLPLLANVITFVGMLIVMLVLDVLLALVVVLAVPLFVLGAGRTGGKVTAAARTQRKAEGRIAGMAGEALGSVRVVQSYRLEGALRERFSRSNAKSLHTGVRAQRLAAGLERRTDLLIGVATAVVLLIGAQRVLAGALTLGELVVFVSYLKSVFKPMRNVAKYTGRISRAAASGERVAEVLDAQPDLRDESWARPLGRVHGDVRLHRVTVAYDGGEPVLQDASLHVRPGEHVGLVGPSGAGKSTVAALLSRLLDPVHGQVLIDGHDLRDLTLDSVRRSIAVVLQDSVLFAESVMENIRFARPWATDDEVRAAAVAADADTFIRELPQGYDTVLAERGSSLSGGQRQRIAIARALLRDAPIVVLDEPTTGLDPQSRDAVLHSLAALTRGRTTIVVAHHEELLAGCHRLLRVADGQITEVRRGPGPRPRPAPEPAPRPRPRPRPHRSGEPFVGAS
ncbi:MAG TPA: ABC transporter ATP-binding protein [Pseudonocardia sp.]|nr:ABC transporter ATP-binding protein [Pseudonocardia sp.]